MANAIDDLCSPTDTHGWASAGIYCFWDYYAEAVLYIGLAVIWQKDLNSITEFYQLKKGQNRSKLRITFREMNA